MGFFPKILIAPGYAQNSDVASALLSLAGTVRGMVLIDSPPATAPTTAIANRGLAGNAFDTSSTRAILCYPQETFYDSGLVPTGVTVNGNTVSRHLPTQTQLGHIRNGLPEQLLRETSRMAIGGRLRTQRLMLSLGPTSRSTRHCSMPPPT